MSLVEVKVPDIGDFDAVEVIELLVKPGDMVSLEQSLITVESDKASMEIPSSAAGVVRELKVKIGDKMSEGTLLMLLDTGAAPGSSAAPAPTTVRSVDAADLPPVVDSPKVAISNEPRAAVPPVPSEASDDVRVIKPHASPSVRRFARELGVDLSKIRGTGPKQRITPEDVRAFVKTAVTRAQGGVPMPAADGGAGLGLIPWPKVDFAKFGPIETRPLSRIKKISAANLHRNWVMIPHVTNHDLADISDLEVFRVRLNAEHAAAGVKVTMLAFLIKACVVALKRFPEFNASLDGERLVLKHYWHIGFAADTPNGLVVPVVRDADQKGVFELARETSELAARARDGKLSPADMQGGTFPISSLGGIGGTAFSPIVNAPEVAILGVSRSARQPVWDEAASQFVPKLMLPLSLSYDHRVIDGAAAARFNAFLSALLSDFRRAML
jgi:pyruvate dehydrogenase E2 component (dihydrolipoamide acetyltransferase)